jgi:hypothetical protein
MCDAARRRSSVRIVRHLGGRGGKVNAGGAVPSPARNAWEKVPDRADEGRRACAAEDQPARYVAGVSLGTSIFSAFCWACARS